MLRSCYIIFGGPCVFVSQGGELIKFGRKYKTFFRLKRVLKCGVNYAKKLLGLAQLETPKMVLKWAGGNCKKSRNFAEKVSL